MKARGVDVVYLHSARGQELAAWFSDTLGLPGGYSDGHWFELDVEQGSRFAVDATGSPPSEVEEQPVMLSFLVDDVRAAVAELAGRGVRFYPSAEDAVFEAGPSLVATFADPEGNWHQLSQRA